MRCQNCGAEIEKNAKFCQYCGSSISPQMIRELELLNKAGCPRCGSTNITFNREKQGEIREREELRWSVLPLEYAKTVDILGR